MLFDAFLHLFLFESCTGAQGCCAYSFVPHVMQQTLYDLGLSPYTLSKSKLTWSQVVKNQCEEKKISQGVKWLLLASSVTSLHFNGFLKAKPLPNRKSFWEGFQELRHGRTNQDNLVWLIWPWVSWIPNAVTLAKTLRGRIDMLTCYQVIWEHL